MTRFSHSILEAFIGTTGYCEYPQTKPPMHAFSDLEIRLCHAKIYHGSDSPVLQMDFAYNNEIETFTMKIKLGNLSVAVGILDFIDKNSRTF